MLSERASGGRGKREKLHSQWASLPVHNGLRFSMKVHFRNSKLPRNPLSWTLANSSGHCLRVDTLGVKNVHENFSFWVNFHGQG